MAAWERVTRAQVSSAIEEYDRFGPERFFSEHGFAPATTYKLAWEGRRYPPKAILGTAYEFATGQRLGSSDFEGRKTGAVRVLGRLGFTVLEKRRTARRRRGRPLLAGPRGPGRANRYNAKPHSAQKLCASSSAK
jgi:hypothetical protein